MFKRYLLFSIGVLLFSMINAQDKIGLVFSQNLSTFRFIDSENNKDDLDISINYGYGFMFNKEINKLFYLSGLINYDKKGAYDSFDTQHLEWSLHYIGVNLNAGLNFDMGRWTPTIGAGLYYGRLLIAEQFIGSDYYNLKSDDLLSKNDVGLNIYGGINYSFSEVGRVFFILKESMGLLQLEETETSSQKMYNRVLSIQTGFTFNIN